MYVQGRRTFPNLRTISGIQGGSALNFVLCLWAIFESRGVPAPRVRRLCVCEQCPPISLFIAEMASGGGFGGGFMPESSMMDTSFGASSQGQPKRESSGNGRVIPVTALMIQKSAARKQSHGDEFVINGQAVTQVKILGQVQEVKETQTVSTYTINDSSGALVEVKRWVNAGDGVREQNARAEVREGMYCWVVGNLRSFSDTPHVSSYVIVPIKSMNEITRHLLEVVYVHLAMTRGPDADTSSMQVR